MELDEKICWEGLLVCVDCGGRAKCLLGAAAPDEDVFSNRLKYSQNKSLPQ